MTGWMLMIRGESLAGTEPAATRCLNSLMLRGVGFGGSCAIDVVDVDVGKMLNDPAVCGADTSLLLSASCSI